MNKSKFNPIHGVLKAVLLTLLLGTLSCGGDYAVGLTKTKQMEAGEIYKIKQMTFQKVGFKPVEFYVLAGSGGDVQERADLVSRFDSKKKAVEFQKQFEPIKTLYARSTSKHFIRAERSARSGNSYRMRKGEVVKVLGMDAQKVTIDGIQGRWIEVLSDTGYRGFSFDYKLELFDTAETSLETAELSGKEKLQQILSQRFYPDSYLQMIQENRLDLRELNSRNGFYLDSESGMIVFKTAEVSATFPLESITEIAPDRFFCEDKKLYITILHEKKLRVSFSLRGEEYGNDLILIEKLTEIAEAEQLKREEFFTRLTEIGTRFNSSSYGELTFNSDLTFSWRNYDRLVPGHVPASAGTRGRISFELYMTSKLESRYDEALTFQFRGEGGIKPVSFFVTLEEEKGAIRLKSVPPVLINTDRLIEKDNLSPIIIYFQAAQEQ